MENAYISVIIPTYNSQSYIKKTLESVFFQSKKPYEIIVVDDGSTDRTIDIVRQCFDEYGDRVGRVQIETQENKGAGSARNKGIKCASGNWISFLDSDDLWKKDKLQAVINLIKRFPEVDMISHDMEIVDSTSHRIKRTNYAEIYDESRPLLPQLYWSNFLVTSCMTIKKCLIDQVGAFDKSLLNAQDYDLWLKLSKYGKLKLINKPFTTYLENRGGSVTSNLRRRYNCEMEICQRYIPDLIKYCGFFDARKRVINRVTRIHISEAKRAIKSGKLRDLMYFVVNYPRALIESRSIVDNAAE